MVATIDNDWDSTWAWSSTVYTLEGTNATTTSGSSQMFYAATCGLNCPTNCPGHTGEMTLVIRNEVQEPPLAKLDLPPRLEVWWPPWREKYQPPVLTPQWRAAPALKFWRTPPRRRLKVKKYLGPLDKMKARRYSN